jgi:hypothetical protein
MRWGVCLRRLVACGRRGAGPMYVPQRSASSVGPSEVRLPGEVPAGHCSKTASSPLPLLSKDEVLTMACGQEYALVTRSEHSSNTSDWPCLVVESSGRAFEKAGGGIRVRPFSSRWSLSRTLVRGTAAYQSNEYARCRIVKSNR